MGTYLRSNNTFHNAYIACAIVAALVSVSIILLPSPHNPEAKQCCAGSPESQANTAVASAAKAADGSSGSANNFFFLWLVIYIYGPCEVSTPCHCSRSFASIIVCRQSDGCANRLYALYGGAGVC
jgi:hypothetical protein